MRLLLRTTAVLSVAWAVLLIGFKHLLIGAAPRTAAAMLAYVIGGVSVALGYCFWQAARHPAAHRGTIYAAIAMFVLKWAFDTYAVLVALPPHPAMICLADLIISISLLVGILQSLPRTLAAGAK